MVHTSTYIKWGSATVKRLTYTLVFQYNNHLWGVVCRFVRCWLGSHDLWDFICFHWDRLPQCLVVQEWNPITRIPSFPFGLSFPFAFLCPLHPFYLLVAMFIALLYRWKTGVFGVWYRPLRARTHQMRFRRNGENRKTKFTRRLKISQMTDWDNKTIIVWTNHCRMQRIT